MNFDVLSAFAICGAGALASAGLLRPSIAHDEASAEVLRMSRAAYALIGVGLTQVMLQPDPVPEWSLAVLSYGAVAGLATLAWSLAALSGRIVPRRWLWPTLGLLLVAILALMPLGLRGITWFVTWGVAGASALVLVLARRLVLRPRELNERLAGAVILLMFGSGLLRVSYLFTWDAPYQPYLLHMPPPLVLVYSMVYGVLPAVFSILLLNVVNARLQARLHQRATTDALTGALSRLALAEGSAALIGRLRGSGRRLAVIIVDIDHFKQVNDRLGHASGDTVLRQVATLLQAQLRPESMLARFGGEEFVALVPVDDMGVARRVAERLRATLTEAPWSTIVPGLEGVTASLGVTLLEPDESLERSLARADEALYRAKNGGRNQVQVGLAAA